MPTITRYLTTENSGRSIMLRLIYHVGVLFYYLYSFWYDQCYVDLPFSKNIPTSEFHFKARYIFLTYWCFTLQAFYFAVAVLNDLFGTNKPRPKETSIIRTVKDQMFVVAFPLASYVSLTFWSIYAVDRELIYPTKLDAIVPSWLNNALHTYIFFFILIECLTSFRPYPSRKHGLPLVIGVSYMYIIWVHVIYFKYDVWVYPVLEVMNWFSRIAFFMFSTLVSLSLYFLTERVNSIVWAKEITPPDNKKAH